MRKSGIHLVEGECLILGRVIAVGAVDVRRFEGEEKDTISFFVDMKGKHYTYEYAFESKAYAQKIHTKLVEALADYYEK